jgi:hypothetical protein
MPFAGTTGPFSSSRRPEPALPWAAFWSSMKI